MTPAAQRVYDEIAKNQRTIVVGPSIRDVAAAVGVGGFAVQRQVAKLRKDGILAPEGGNGLVLVAQANTRSTMEKLIVAPSVIDRAVRAPIPRPNGKI